MRVFGSDKPDTRIGTPISEVAGLVPSDLVSKITSLTSPAIDALKFEILDTSPKKSRDFIAAFMETPEGLEFQSNPDGAPGVFISDYRAPLKGLHAFGFDGSEKLGERFEFQPGDLFVVQAREDTPFTGGSTALGRLRLALHKYAVNQGLRDQSKGFEPLWVIDFPLFSPVSESEPGQGGTVGLASTHHPFTSPKSEADVDLLLIDSTKVIGDHYDLVINGVELGGGSRRIHNAEMQEFVMRDVLKMTPERVDEFSHLLKALRAGCPPHAGIALGFDRLIAVMLGKESVRDVIAFPKTGKGEDPMVKSPATLTEEQLQTYHLKLRE